jgi:hypothetical protein
MNFEKPITEEDYKKFMKHVNCSIIKPIAYKNYALSIDQYDANTVFDYKFRYLSAEQLRIIADEIDVRNAKINLPPAKPSVDRC